jgi:leader peptidase (prepilin peptidase)/N-methyltransferase
MCLFAAILVALIFSDLEERILPDELTLGGIAAGLVFAYFVPVPQSIAQLFLSGRVGSVAEAALGACVPTFILWFAGWLYQRVRHREGLGLGDVKLIAMVGSFLGLGGALLTLIGGSLGGSIIGYTYIKLRGKDPATYELPFGTFLAAAALALAVAGQKVLEWYGGL